MFEGNSKYSNKVTLNTPDFYNYTSSCTESQIELGTSFILRLGILKVRNATKSLGNWVVGICYFLVFSTKNRISPEFPINFLPASSKSSKGLLFTLLLLLLLLG
jgi:hypothetical protein